MTSGGSVDGVESVAGAVSMGASDVIVAPIGSARVERTSLETPHAASVVMAAMASSRRPCRIARHAR